MNLIVNGQEKTTKAKTIQELLNELQIEEKVMAAAVNMNVVKKEDWESFKFNEGNKEEFLKLVGGGRFELLF